MVEIILKPVVVIPIVIFLFLPWNAYLRVGVWIIIFAALIFILAGASGDDGFGTAILGLLFIFLLMLWGVAGLFQLILRRIITGAWPEARHLRSDWTLVWAGYALLALCVFLFTAFKMAGSEHVTLIHAVLFFIAIASFREPGFAICLTLLTCYSLFHARIVTNAASDAVAGADYCIYLNQRRAFSDDWQDFTFITMDKGDWSRHAFVIAKDEPGLHGYWSYNQRAFVTTQDDWYFPTSLTCPKE